MYVLAVYLGFIVLLSGTPLAWAALPDSGSSVNLPRVGAQYSPTRGQFESMLDAADYYATLDDQGWAPISAGPLLHPGQTHPQVAAVRSLLWLYGDYPQHLTEPRLELFDAELTAALRRFQRRHGLKPDAKLGKNTRRALNIPPQARAYQLLLNHERQLALRKRVPSQYVQVNLPEFRLRLYQGHKSILEMKIIVGRRSRSTPTFDSEISSLVFNPGWNVPRSIAYKDILPRWTRDADYLGRQNMRIVSGFGANRVWIDTSTAVPEQLYKGDSYPRLYQLPGRNNALGQIKFVSKNRSAIYLHDTPVKALFERHQRAFSSGCVRVENPHLLARHLLGTQTMQQPLDELLAGVDTRRIRLQTPVRLYLTYWTAWLDRQQGVQFRTDIYHRDPPPELGEWDPLSVATREAQYGS